MLKLPLSIIPNLCNSKFALNVFEDIKFSVKSFNEA